MKLPPPTEYAECLVLVEWLELQQNLGNVLLFSHVPSETFTKSWKQKAKNKASGVRRGVPDYIVITGASHVCFVEMKRISRSNTSAEQKEWIEALSDCQPTVHAKVCYGAQEVMDFKLTPDQLSE